MTADCPRPRLFLTAHPTPGLRSVDSFRQDIGTPAFQPTWETLLKQVERDIGAEPIRPDSDTPGRPAVQIRHANADYFIVSAACRRVQYAALAALVTGEPAFRDSALRQVECLFDETAWPEWRDQAHRNVAADLRTGSLASALAVAYDWLHASLTPEQRHWMVDGLDRRAIRPYFRAVHEKASYVDGINNWMTCIVGGLGIAGMALDGAHPRARELVDLALPRMERYLLQFGPEGEFNESVGYANAMQLAVEFYLAHRYWTGGGENRLGRTPFPEFGRWLMAMTLPPGRLAALGDAGTEAPPATDLCAAIAAAAGDPVLQGFWRTYPETLEGRRNLIRTLLWPDPAVPAVTPDGRLPKGRVFQGHGMTYSSRSDWDLVAAACVVYGKGGHGRELHGHHDAGQVCVDGYGRRLIVDPGNPSLYPADFFGPHRWRYYNAAARGHNILMFDGESHVPDAAARARWEAAHFDDARGGYWILDLGANYAEVRRVRRTMLHLLPGIVAVLDEAELPRARDMSLRWHTAVPCEAACGAFGFEVGGVRVAARIQAVDGPEPVLRAARQRYHAPFDRGRLGDPLEQRNEPYIEAALRSDRCRWLTLFAVFGPGEEAVAWTGVGKRWTIRTAQGEAEVTVTTTGLEARRDAVRVTTSDD